MTEFQEIRTFTIECPNPDCPDPSDVRRNGTEGDRQVYRCNTCDKAFMEGNAMNRQFTTRQIGAALDKYYSGMSYKQIGEFMEDFFEVPEPSKSSIHDWVKGYTIMARRFLDGEVGANGREESATGKPVKAETGDHWVADEMQVKVGGHPAWLWNVMDKDSRYVLAAYLSKGREAEDAFRVMEKAIAASESPPKTITTDGLGSYNDPIKALFPKSTEHAVSESINNELNNNISERLQGTFRSRSKTQRGLQAIRTGQDYVDGYVIDYNYFKKHEALGGRVPAEAARVAEQVPWGDSWEGVAKLGGEVAERRNVVVDAVKRKPGPKPRNPESVKSAVEEYLATERKRKQSAAAKEQYKNRNKSPVASYPPKHRRQPVRRGRGRIRL